MSKLCEECKGEVRYDRGKGYTVCLKCGLIHEMVEMPPVASSITRSRTSIKDILRTIGHPEWETQVNHLIVKNTWDTSVCAAAILAIAKRFCYPLTPVDMANKLDVKPYKLVEIANKMGWDIETWEDAVRLHIKRICGEFCVDARPVLEQVSNIRKGKPLKGAGECIKYMYPSLVKDFKIEE